MMDAPLVLDWIADRAERWLGTGEIVSRRPDRSLTRTTYAQVIARARRLARALIAAGIRRGDRVATLMWNHSEHLEAYFGIPLAGGAVHTLNLRLHPDEIAFIANDARDRILIVDDVLVPLYEKVRAAGATFERVIVVGSGGDYEAFLAGAPDGVELPALAEHDALGVCYTSGTTGRPKGVVYSHRSTILHSLVAALPDCLDLSHADTLLPVVPMFHVNAWGLPYIAAFTGAKLVLPGCHLDPASLLELMAGEHVTVAAGVPTIWIGIRDLLDADRAKYALEPGLRMIVGGSAAPEQLIRDFDRHGLSLLHAWGMTETSPIGTVARVPATVTDADTRYKLRARQGRPVPFVDLRVRNEAGDVPRDDRTQGEVLVRGPWIASAYAGGHSPDRWTADGYFRTGDVARVDEHGFIQLVDRIADLIKSGGEWIATQELENALMGHPAVREAAVIGVAHPKWSERPLAVVVLKAGAACTPDDLRAHLAPRFAKFWLPDAFVFVEAIPRTSAGKFKKTELRERFRDWAW
ncbi:MAG TPA: long-chain fatty acid--CoA ligase [Kofleriaceae bacterium]|nr:long-chain fatty acid--CoA ligase [Kofleriaceae bacterium]